MFEFAFDLENMVPVGDFWRFQKPGCIAADLDAEIVVDHGIEQIACI